MAIVSMNVSVNGAGTVPLGAIIPVGNVGAWALPASGEIKDGFALCNGTAFPSGSHPSFTGNRPNLTDSRFLRGSSSTGGTGGAVNNQITLVIANLPSHSHGIDHIHTVDHSHTATASTNGAHRHKIENPIPESDPRHDWVSWNTSPIANGNGGPEFNRSLSAFDNQYLMQTEIEPSHSHAITVNSATVNSSSPKVTSDRTIARLSSDSTGSGTAVDITPQYFNVVYIMRVI